MKLYSIMPMLDDHVEEICDNIEAQYRDGVASEALFMIKLQPEGVPTADKAGIACRKYELYAAELAKRGLSCGILAQSTIGHVHTGGEKTTMQHVVGLLNGREEGSICPYDEGFRDYIRDAMVKLAKCNPTTIMVDDDFRLFGRNYRGCLCPLHMKEINRRAGTSYTREELTDLLNTDTEESRRMCEIFYDTQIDSLVGAARAMREGIDSVNPRLQGAFCACGDTVEGVDQIAPILAGKGNPVIIRVNNARYATPGARDFTKVISRAATQMAALDKVDAIFLAETDTCPQNRYSTSASNLHSHFTLSILEGVAGCKHWITRTAAFEPNSGLAYRKILKKYAGFYHTLSETVPDVEWFGCRIPLATRPLRATVPIRDFQYPTLDAAWYSCALEVLGLPVYFSKNEGGAVFLDGDRDGYFTDDEIQKMLAGTVFMSSLSAKNLIDRGFGDYLGATVSPLTPDDPSPRGERIYETGQLCQKQKYIMRLSPNKPETVAHSEVYTLHGGTKYEAIFPGVTSYQNVLGGTVVVFAGRPLCQFLYTEGFSFRNESRKKQFIALLSACGHLPVYYPEDAEVFIKAGRTSDGRILCTLINVGLDRLEEIPLHTDRPIAEVQMLNPDGTFVSCPFTMSDAGNIVVQASADVLIPVVLMIKEN